MTTWKKSDLHLHTSFSGWRQLHLIDAQDCYVPPDEAFATARRRGMDYVAFTDHDTIDGALDFLSRHPEEEPRVIIGEEVEVRLAGTTGWIHLNVYGVDERTHQDLARLRGDALEAIAYLRERRLPFVLNHPFQSFRSIRAARRHLDVLLPLVPAVEVCNSSSPRVHRRVVESMLDGFPNPAWARIGGSDAHTTRRIAAAYTLAPGDTKAAFLDSIRRGECEPGGEALGMGALVRDIYQVIWNYYAQLYGGPLPAGMRRRPGNVLGSIALLPAVILGLPVTLSALHVVRQVWIARFGAWAAEAPETAAGEAVRGEAENPL
ncbi:MAG TPA: PHP domain-containing protein [Patescibacteria group bacterium]|nr:PHP domain-containing protein [Patescibacteria group bacterium]